MLLLIAYFLNLMPFVILVLLIMWAGAILGIEKAGLFYLTYTRMRKILKSPPNEGERNPLELRFTQGLGAAFLTAAVILYYLRIPQLAWAIVLLVAVLSFLATLGFCLAAITYVGFKKFCSGSANHGRE